MTHTVKVEKEISKATPVKTSNGRLTALSIICVPLLAFSIYSWIARPPFIWGPKVVPLPALEQEANIRFAMVLLVMRIDSYRETEGLYPSSLAAVGEALAGVTYTLIADTIYELKASQNGMEITFRSDQPADAFLGNSAAIIQGSSR
jgi:hypothetical protein